MSNILKLTLIFLLSTQFSYATSIDTTRVYGVTIDATDGLSSIVASLSNMSIKPTTRIVFDPGVPATDYVNAVNQIHNVSFIMGELVDSYCMSTYTLAQYTARTIEYLNALENKVDIWEVGNEINGSWNGPIDSVVSKMNAAFNIVKSRNKKTALTLFYCWDDIQHQMYYWVNHNLSSAMKNGLDYVWVSYYEDDCGGYQTNWQRVFDSLRTIFPNSKLGIGECGTNDPSKKATYVNKYYKMNISNPNFVGGYFWWYFKQDCVPYTKALWRTLDSALSGFNSDRPRIFIQGKAEKPLLDNYPNPFNPVTKIRYTIQSNGLVTLKVYDLSGREIANLVNEIQQAGTYSVEFNGLNLSSGVYLYRLSSGNNIVTKKMILIK